MLFDLLHSLMQQVHFLFHIQPSRIQMLLKIGGDILAHRLDVLIELFPWSRKRQSIVA